MLKLLFIVLFFFSFVDCQECPSAYTSVGGGCFRAVNYALTDYAHAKDICGKYNGNLAIVNNCSLLGDLARYFHFSGLEADNVTGYWIGATYNDGTWLWTDTTEVPSGAPFWGSVMNGSEWVAEPSGEPGETCALLKTNDQYYFHDEICTESANVLCQHDNLKDNLEYEGQYVKKIDPDEDADDSTCPEDFIYIYNSCFHFHYEAGNGSTKMNWHNAQTLCHDHYSSSHLAIIDSCDLFREVVNFITTNDAYDVPDRTSYWIGASDENQEGHWYWINLAPVAMGIPFWGKAGEKQPEPSGGLTQNCATMYKSDGYYFHDGECNYNAYPFCQTNPL